MERMLTIGQLAASSGVSADTIRYYERIRLLAKPQRTPAGYRLYPPHVVNRLAVIRNAQRFGFSLDELAAFLRVRDSGGTPCHDVRAAAGRILDAVDRQIRELVSARTRMRRTLRDWDAALADTPAHERAHLLERLAATRGARTRARRGFTTSRH